LDRFVGVLSVDHPKQVLCFPVGCMCWASTGVTTTTISCCDDNDFIFATHRISSGTNGLQDCQALLLAQKKEAKEISRKREASKGREAILFVFLLLVCLPHRNFAPTGIHKLSDFTHHFLWKQ
jgi:hypothetical protein